MSTKYYNLKNIRTLLTEGFTVEELRRLCYDTSEFRAVYDQLAEGTRKAKIADLLLKHADQKLQLEVLLALVKEQNPTRYEKYQPYTNLITFALIPSKQKPSLRDFRRWLLGD